MYEKNIITGQNVRKPIVQELIINLRWIESIDVNCHGLFLYITCEILLLYPQIPLTV